ncbi:MAG: serine protease [Bacteroidota bacterium]
MQRLTGAEIAKLRDIMQASLNMMSIRTFTSARLNEPYDNYVSPLAGLGDGIFQYISQLNSRFKHYELIDALVAEFPNDPELLKFAADWALTPSGENQNQEAVVGKSGLEKLVNDGPFLNVDVLLQDISRVERTVCRIQVFRKNGRVNSGTGFLIGKDLVMTNHHVIYRLIDTPNQIEDVICLFDFKVKPDGTALNDGREVKLADHPIVHYSKVDPLDVQGESQLDADWDTTKLDYAIIRLAEPIGEQGFGQGDSSASTSTRGWITIPDTAPTLQQGGHGIIIQHPKRKPKKIAFGFEKILAVDPKGIKVRYDINTEGGSSGSPCFNEKFELIALHHAGDPDDMPHYNQGIVMAKIKADIEANNIQLS